mmetsp:Transcript_31323/g.78610  ORF Transcript_31323/g.78610 Transcript_31323/m.78610 type:complete len:391 (-) Transcript_31323:58-1230(-)|eukprot:CAMPEP_0177653582 /NCGR_PEP_ID=MMETSP0447-20121125/13817_1 /TAXON_ID=0 /ORGANISM="Stygamoeba regulata, Strain BSH-02190019" /LENGTH=390 /DNA_ID=CAMNT_0019157057 /DNA_START=166 /DNA_END=1338 /DNA_ORIENTATION=-
MSNQCLPPFPHFGTDTIHAGQPPNPETGAVIVPISLATTFQQPSPGVFKEFEYSRSGNPTRKAFEELIAKCENGKHGLGFASGLAATSAVVNCLPTGSHVIVCDDVYGGTNRLFRRICTPSNNLSFDFVDLTDPANVTKFVKENTKMVWVESPTNPTLKLVDIAGVSAVAHAHNLPVLVDNTFMSPYFQRPLDLGADIVLHSCSKYIGGHSDVIMGALVTNSDEWCERLRFVQNGMGGVPSPFDCFLAIRGMKTLHLRMRQHEVNARAAVALLETHAKVERVVYPGLASHPSHDLAKRQMTGFGGMVVFYLKGGLAESKRFLESLKLIALAESLGGVESLVEHPAIMTHASVPPEQRKQLGISDNMIRLSVGVEDTEDVLDDLRAALEAV